MQHYLFPSFTPMFEQTWPTIFYKFSSPSLVFLLYFLVKEQMKLWSFGLVGWFDKTIGIQRVVMKNHFFCPRNLSMSVKNHSYWCFIYKTDEQGDKTEKWTSYPSCLLWKSDWINRSCKRGEVLGIKGCRSHVMELITIGFLGMLRYFWRIKEDFQEMSQGLWFM